MAETADVAIQLLQIVGTVFGLLFIVIQILVSQGQSRIRPAFLIEILKTILLAMFLLLVAAGSMVWVLIHEINPNLIFPVGLVVLSLCLVFLSTGIVFRELIKHRVYEEVE